MSSNPTLENETTRWTLIPERITELRRMVAEICAGNNVHSCIAIRDMLTESIQQTEKRAADIKQLMRFYGVETLEELALQQAGHVERLQAQLPEKVVYSTARVREG